MNAPTPLESSGIVPPAPHVTLPRFGLLLVGDELLSGRRADQHVPKTIELLAARGLTLSYVHMVGDARADIAAQLRSSLASGDVVFSCGGIGATPDDLTREAAARAFDRPLTRHPEAEARIVAQFGNDALPYRVLMADLPQDCGLIPNPINNVPGFFLHDCYFMPGFPQMAHPMLDWVLNTHFAHAGDPDYAEAALWVWDASENQLLELMRDFEQTYPALKLFSLPILPSETQPRRRIELGLKGARPLLQAAMQALHDRLTAQGFAVSSSKELPPEQMPPNNVFHGTVD